MNRQDIIAYLGADWDLVKGLIRSQNLFAP